MDGVNGVSNQTQNYQGTTTEKKSDDSLSLGKEDFLMLFIESLKNQDPMSPMDSNAMMQQLSQLGQMEAVANLKLTVNEMRESILDNQMIQASGLLGSTIYAENSDGTTITGVPTAYRLNDGVIEYLVNNQIVTIGQIREVGLTQGSVGQGGTDGTDGTDESEKEDGSNEGSNEVENETESNQDL